MNLPSFALRYPAIVVAGTLVLVLWGIVAFFTMPRREDPEFEIRTCLITTSWPGATAEKVEQLITDPVETAVDTIDEVDKIRSLTTVGQSVVFVELRDEVKNADQVWDKIRAKVDGVRSQLPEGSAQPYVNDDFGDTSAMVLAVFQRPLDGEETRQYTPRELEIIASRLKDELKLIRSVAQVDLYGVQDEVIYLEVDAGKWSQLGLTTDQLQKLLQQRNIVASGGSIDTPWSRFGVKPSGEINTIAELDRVILGLHETGAPVYLQDVDINVSRRHREPPNIIARYGDAKDSAPCVVLSVTMKSGEKITEMGKVVRAKLEQTKKTVLPRDIEIAVVSDQPTVVADKIGKFVGNVAQAIVIVVLVAFLLVGLRIALVMAASIPLVMLSSIGISRLFGVELDQVSISALIIALGMLVDNAIEVCDNTHRLLAEGHRRLEAAKEGARQLAFPILIATLTTVFAFLPMLVALKGDTQEYVSSLPIVVSITLLVSWLMAMTITTLMAYRIMRPTHSLAPLPWLAGMLKKALRRKGASEGPTLGDCYANAAAACLRHKFLTIGVAFAMFLGACALIVTGLVGTKFFPSADRNQFLVDIFLPEGSPIYSTDKVCRKVEGILRQLSRDFSSDGDGQEVEPLANMVSYVGQGGPRFYISIDPEQPAGNYAQILVNTVHPEVVDQFVAKLRNAVHTRVPGARIVPRKLVLGPPVDNPIGIRVFGEESDDMNTLRHYAERVKSVLRDAEGTWNVHDSWGVLGYQLDVEVDQDRANLAGVSNASIAQTLNAFFSGHYLTTYREGDHQVPVYLRLPAERRAALDQIDSVYVEGAFGKVPIDSVATVQPRRQTARIQRWNLSRMIEVRARVSQGKLANSVLAGIMPQIRQIERSLPPGYRIEIGGEQEETAKAQGEMMVSFGISCLFIVLCLVVQYNSLTKPLIILMTLPMATTGAFIGLYLTGQPLGFMAMLGLLSLAGVVLNDNIVLVEFIEMQIKDKQQKQDGLPRPGEKSCSGLNVEAFRQSVIDAARLRVVPIWLTTLTTVGGLLPLALAGGPLFEPMAIVIIFGLLLDTLLTLFVVPAMFSVFVEHLGVSVGEKVAL